MTALPMPSNAALQAAQWKASTPLCQMRTERNGSERRTEQQKAPEASGEQCRGCQAASSSFQQQQRRRHRSCSLLQSECVCRSRGCAAVVAVAARDSTRSRFASPSARRRRATTASLSRTLRPPSLCTSTPSLARSAAPCLCFAFAAVTSRAESGARQRAARACREERGKQADLSKSAPPWWFACPLQQRRAASGRVWGAAERQSRDEQGPQPATNAQCAHH
jgi:hypothetical protein